MEANGSYETLTITIRPHGVTTQTATQPGLSAF